jgi:phospho-N-acetylmuramoyl-pentapeptide-transferase
MLYHLLYPLRDSLFMFNVFRYITFRAALGFLLSFLIVMFLGSRFIRYLRRIHLEEHVDMYGHVKLEQIFSGKRGTPTMGGILIGFSIIVSVLLCARLDTMFIWLSLGMMAWFMSCGLLDDYLKLKTKKGLNRIQKLSLQIVGGVGLGGVLYATQTLNPTINFPFLKDMAVNIGAFYVLWVALVVTATCNAVNFTDGLDGLAMGSVLMVALVFSILSYITGNAVLSNYLLVQNIPGSGELAVVCSCILGAGLGFLWFNAHPAEVFMGDVGSSLLGGLLGTIAVLVKKELLLLIAGGLFVLEALSVIGQIFWVRVFGKRLLSAAPFHHHLRLSGWDETKVTTRLWILSMLFAALSLMTLKIR